MTRAIDAPIARPRKTDSPVSMPGRGSGKGLLKLTVREIWRGDLLFMAGKE